MNNNIILALERFESAKQYWLEKLSGIDEEIKMPTDFFGIDEYTRCEYRTVFSEEITNRILTISNGQDLALYVILMTALKTIFFKLSGQNDIIIGSPVYGKEEQQYNKYIVLRDYLHSEMSFKELLINIKETVEEGYKKQYYPFETILKLLDIREDLSLFRVMLVLDGIHNEEFVTEGINSYKNDITFYLQRVEKRLEVKIIYNKLLFKEETISKISNWYEYILSQALFNLNRKVRDLELVNLEEKKKIIEDFNNNRVLYQSSKIIHQLFQEQVVRTPDQIALIFDEEYITYYELNRRANCLAHLLRSKGVIRETIVGVMIENSISLIVALLGILKAGGAYVPIDPEYPLERIEYILQDSNIHLLLTQHKYMDNVSFGGEILDIEVGDIFDEDKPNLDIVNLQSDMAYVIYTSGSTGKPKGVVIEHRSLVNYVCWRIRKFEYTHSDKTLQLISSSFDGFNSNFYSSVLSGGTMVLLNQTSWRDFNYVKDVIRQKQITNMSLVPSMYMAILENAKKEDLETLRFIVFGGDRIYKNIVAKSLSIIPHTMLANEYGPTEGTVAAVALTGINTENNLIIGQPINNCQVYILGKDNSIMPLGVRGELCISGEGLARGYINNIDLTTQKFVPNPFNPGERMYRTGDIAKWLPDGNIEFIGREDNQIKIRGYRIELQEVEACIISNESISEAVVTAIKDKEENTFLCAYIISNEKVIIEQLREYLISKLPEYMIPTYFVQIEKIPLTPNGKIDRRTLSRLKPDINNYGYFEEPSNEEEKILEGIWREILGVEKIGVNHNFFLNGGHSLKAVLMSTKIQQEFNVKISLREIFRHPTIRELVKYIKMNRTDECLRLHIAEIKECYSLSPAQKRIYIMHQFEGIGIGYNMPGANYIEGNIDKIRAERVLNNLIERHESLRTSFEIRNGEVVQRIHENIKIEIEYAELDNELSKEEEKIWSDSVIREFIRPFDISKAPLIRAKLVKLNNERCVLIYDMHHIISDGVSMLVLMKEFSRLYKGEELLPMRIQYKDYSEWQNALSKTAMVKQQEEYWLKKFSGNIPVLNLPNDFPRPVVQSFEGDCLNFKIVKEYADKLYKISSEAGVTIYMLLMAAFYLLLFKQTEQEDITIGTVTAGRNHPDLENVIGMFINTLAIRNRPEAQKKFSSFLGEVKESLLEAYENQDYQFEELVNKLKIKRDLSRGPLFDVVISLQNIDTPQTDECRSMFKPYIYENKVSKNDLVLLVDERNNEIMFKLQYCTKLFKRSTIEILANDYRKILTDITRDIHIKISDIVPHRCQTRPKTMIPEDLDFNM